MREIKFRAWVKDAKCFAEIRHINFFKGKTVVKIYDQPMSEEVWFELEDLELLQYTGLKDKNGIEIYEGDILTSENYPFQDEGKYNYHGIVEWADEVAAICITKRLVNKSKRGISDGIADIIEDTEQFQVIGNIYENPELLEVSK